MKKILFFTLLTFSLVLVGCAQQTPTISEQPEQPASQPTDIPATTQPTEPAMNVNKSTSKSVDAVQSVDPTENWEIYQNNEYGFEIKYPSKYKTVIDNYGWLNSVIHFIEKEPGTQAYRATISVWNNQDDYEKSTVYSAMRYSLHNVGSKYIAISYFATDNENDLINEWQKIINTLKSIK